jgi:hypothetical protein
MGKTIPFEPKEVGPAGNMKPSRANEEIYPPGKLCCSNIFTLNPARARYAAAVRPAIPAPMMMISGSFFPADGNELTSTVVSSWNSYRIGVI